eukprot:CAMPEP_0201257658 /NCGR_PEP_ID=MMETSP0853-20130426/1738_1 /ASSEMBLY_ACC=CAM_ASM_000640 /TAXON_ID=183588 /ORGANISM="Pseudo-nitzschia fraudulenta, Strain WWA7" /LENGTH=117 /DNA_ID=CAMNT_0047558451 /DNA_START=117 /DNA_END=468 /DNA_ORIENTATION=+
MDRNHNEAGTVSDKDEVITSVPVDTFKYFTTAEAKGDSEPRVELRQPHRRYTTNNRRQFRNHVNYKNYEQVSQHEEIRGGMFYKRQKVTPKTNFNHAHLIERTSTTCTSMETSLDTS